MGIYDREYIVKRRHGGNPLAPVFQTAVGTIIVLNLIAWVAQILTRPALGQFAFGAGDLGPVTNFLAATPQSVFSFHVWKLVTANFAHSPYDVWHILGNMLFLYFFGRELEQIYGRRDFWIFYLASGIIAVLAETLLLAARGVWGVPVLGASGAVMAVTVLFALFYPNRTIALMFFIPAPVWVWCLIYIGVDLFGLLSPVRDQV